MRVHYLQHVPFEDLGSMRRVLFDSGHTITATRLYEPYSLPTPDQFDWLIVMGGPMGVYDDHLFTWLVDEKQFIQDAIKDDKIVLGICLGAVHLARSTACENQAFIYGQRVLALQYHLETTRKSAEALVENCGHELVDGPYIQSAEFMLSSDDRFVRINDAMKKLLEQLAAVTI